MKRLFSLFVFALTVLCLVACTAEYDVFEASQYKVFKNISFVEQDGETSVSEEDHVISVTTVAPPESLETWDSLTIESISASNLATLHLVDGKFKEFPSDSAGLDSLAQEVSYVKKSLKEGSKIRIPKSLVVYVMLVAENGDPAIWKIQFTIPGVESESSSSVDNGNIDSSSSGNSDDQKGESSSSVGAESSSSRELSDDVSLEVVFEYAIADTLIEGKDADTIRVTMPMTFDMDSVKVKKVALGDGAAIDENLEDVKDWRKSQKVVVTAENGDTKAYVVQVLKEKQNGTLITKFVLDNQAANAVIDQEKHTVSLKVKKDFVLAQSKVTEIVLSEGASIDPDPTTLKTWAESLKFTVTAEDGSTMEWTVLSEQLKEDYQASSEKELLSFEVVNGTVTMDANKKTVNVVFANKSEMASAKITYEISPKASGAPASGSTISLVNGQTLTITAEDGSEVTWNILSDYVKSSAKELESITFNPAPKESSIDKADKTVNVTYLSTVDIGSVTVKGVCSDATTGCPNGTADLTKDFKFTIVAEDGSKDEWTVKTTVEQVSIPDPELKSIKLAGLVAIIDHENKTVTINNLPFNKTSTYSQKSTDLTDLTQVEISELDAVGTTNKQQGDKIDVSFGTDLTITSNGKTLTYKVKGGYQYPGSDFNSWVSDAFGNTNDVVGWDNGNNDAASSGKTLTVNDGRMAIKMETKSIVGKIASGNMLIGDFNPNKVPSVSISGDNMLKYDDGNELIDFGKPFAGRPEYIEFDAKYSGKNDSCDMYVIFENRSGGPDATNKNRNGSVNKMVASAWYRATTLSDSPNRTNPDLISVKPASTEGYVTVRLKINYGDPLAGSPIESSSVYSSLKNKNGIDNHLNGNDGTLPVTHIRIVVASSAGGNLYKGVAGATLYVDEIRLIY